MTSGTGRPAHLLRGAAGEALAEAWLVQQGLKPLMRNFRCRPGEIDLVMREGDILVFVEVRFRRDCGFGTALESVTAGKQRRLLRAAAVYLQQHGDTLPCRFDVVGISPGPDGHPVYEWVRDAFRAD